MFSSSIYSMNSSASQKVIKIFVMNISKESSSSQGLGNMSSFLNNPL